MIDLNNLGHYRENNRIEAKMALGGLPHSVWETYSAFANTLGGLILLGVVEYPDKSLHAVDLPDPEGMVRSFWDLVNDPNTASVNILSAKDVTIELSEGRRIIVINVPRAERSDKPVYVDGSPRNTYRRSGEGDYRCTAEEYRAMVRDAALRTQDMLVREELDADALNTGSVRAYRRRMKLSRPEHVWEALADEDFLLRLGALGVGGDGQKHPTSAGLLMFGNGKDIVRAFPHYLLEYSGAEHLVSSTGDWSGNVLDFYFLADQKLQQDAEGLSAPVRGALREALANCLVNADYCGGGALTVVRQGNELTMTNPGHFRIDVATAKSGGLSDPRNGAMSEMFHLIDIGERVGGGIPNIFRVWREQGWAEPAITQSFAPDRTTLSLVFGKADGKKQTVKKSDELIRERQKNAVIEYLTDNASAGASEIAEALGVGATRAREALAALIAEDIVVAEGGGRSRTYRLKS